MYLCDHEYKSHIDFGALLLILPIFLSERPSRCTRIDLNVTARGVRSCTRAPKKEGGHSAPPRLLRSLDARRVRQKWKITSDATRNSLNLLGAVARPWSPYH